MRPRLLFLASRPPFPMIGPHTRIFHAARYLRADYDIDLLYLNEGSINPGVHASLAAEFSRVVPFPYAPWRFRWNALCGLASSLPLQVHYYRFAAVKRWMEANLERYQAVVANHIRMAEYVKDAPIPVLIDLHDAISLNYARALVAARGLRYLLYRIEQPRVLRYELEVLRSFPCSFVISPVDRNFLISHGADPDRFMVVPVAIQDHVLQRPPFPGPEQRTIVFLGKMSTHPNEDAACFFAEEVLPLIHARCPDLEFVVVGADPSARVSALAHRHPKVTVTGFVTDPYSYLERALVVVAPIRFGAGILNKVIESMALRKAVVTTAIGAEPIGAVHGRHLLVAEDAEGFAGAVLSLVESPAQRRELGHNASMLVRERFSWATVGAQFQYALQLLLGTSASSTPVGAYLRYGETMT